MNFQNFALQGSKTWPSLKSRRELSDFQGSWAFRSENPSFGFWGWSRTWISQLQIVFPNLQGRKLRFRTCSASGIKTRISEFVIGGRKPEFLNFPEFFLNFGVQTWISVFFLNFFWIFRVENLNMNIFWTFRFENLNLGTFPALFLTFHGPKSEFRNFSWTFSELSGLKTWISELFLNFFWIFRVENLNFGTFPELFLIFQGRKPEFRNFSWIFSEFSGSKPEFSELFLNFFWLFTVQNLNFGTFPEHFLNFQGRKPEFLNFLWTFRVENRGDLNFGTFHIFLLGLETGMSKKILIFSWGRKPFTFGVFFSNVVFWAFGVKTIRIFLFISSCKPEFPKSWGWNAEKSHVLGAGKLIVGFVY